MSDNKIEIKLNAKQASTLELWIAWLVKRNLAKDVTDKKYYDEFVPRDFDVRVRQIFVNNQRTGGILTSVLVRRWHDIALDNANSKSKCYIYKVTLIGLLLILSTEFVSNKLALLNIAYKDGDTIEDLVSKVFPDAELVK